MGNNKSFFPALQAHRGVSTECPENTISAFTAAILQGYELIELDPAYTSDGRIVVLHDKTLNRTARHKDGTPLTEPVSVSEITYAEALEYDFGIGFSPKFAGEPIPLLEDVLQLAQDGGVRVKVDNKIERFPQKAKESLFRIIRQFGSTVGITSANADTVLFYANEFPLAELHYDGPVTEEILAALSHLGKRLTVWMPHQSPLTSWVKVPFADPELCRAVKKIAKLGIWILKDTDEFDAVCTVFAPDIVETTGAVKPHPKGNLLCDMHVHSQNSHDSTCPVLRTAEAAVEKGVSLFAVTDHADMDKFVRRDTARTLPASLKEADEADAAFCPRVRVLRGIELSEGFWQPALTAEILAKYSFDVIIGSAHSVRFENYSGSYSCIDFSDWPMQMLVDYVRQYFDDILEMLKTVPCDIMAHLTCPFRYINGKYGRGLDTHLFEEQILTILAYIRDHGIAMEVNTSGIGTAFGIRMPDDWILQKYREIGGYLITLGSDAHTAENLGKGFDETRVFLKSVGFRAYYYCKGRFLLPCAL